MRQSTLAFGQKPLNTPQPQIAQSSSSQQEKSETTKAKFHSFFAKRVRKDEEGIGKENDSKEVEVISIEDDDSPPSKKRLISESSNVPKQKIRYIEAPWPGKGESSIQPQDEAEMSDISLTLSAFEKQNKCENDSEMAKNEQSQQSWSWLYTPKVSNLNDQEEGDLNSIDIYQFFDTQIDLKSCRNKEDQLPEAVEHAKLAALTPSNCDKTSSLWTDKWRPARADQVLGNEKQAIYLRDWLQALKVADKNLSVITNNTASFRPVVKRAPKKRGRPTAQKEMDDFIVGDTEEEEAWFDQFRKKELVPPDLPFDSLSQSSTITIPIEDGLDFNKSTQLTNVIILEGPSGCGKTASVYACAKELGFDVFEIFPGMGKRSGLHLSTMVGDLCTNHTVSGGGTGGGAFQKKLIGTSLDTKEIGAKSLEQTRQSLILFEEVDVMYEDDKGFWQGIIDLARGSLRPLILTCNDITAVPLNDLPVQRILQFSPPSVSMAVPYLQLISLAEGKQIDSNTVQGKYVAQDRIQEQTKNDAELLFNSSGPLRIVNDIDPYLGSCDLRQAMMQLQFDSERLRLPRSDDQQTMNSNRLRSSILAAELKSYADWIFTRSHSTAAAELEFEQTSPNRNDLTTLDRSLYHSPNKGDEVCLPAYRCEQEYQELFDGAAFALRGSQYIIPLDFHHRRAQFSNEIQDILSCLNVTPQSRIPSSETVLDYAPFIQKMVLIDDEEEDMIRVNAKEMIKEGASEEGVLMERGHSRQKLNIIRKGDEEGLLNLLYRESNFSRWLPLSDQMNENARSFSPSQSHFDNVF